MFYLLKLCNQPYTTMRKHHQDPPKSLRQSTWVYKAGKDWLPRALLDSELPPSLMSHSKPVSSGRQSPSQKPSFPYLASSKIPPWLPESCNKPKLQPGILPGTCTKAPPLMNPTAFTALWTAPNRPVLRHLPWDANEGIGGEHLKSLLLFFNLKM